MQAITPETRGRSFGLHQATDPIVAVAFTLPAGHLPILVAIFFIVELYVAAQEAPESTVIAEMVSKETLATSYSALVTINGATKFVSSAAVGMLWSTVSSTFGFAVAAALMTAGTLALARLTHGDNTFFWLFDTSVAEHVRPEGRIEAAHEGLRLMNMIGHQSAGEIIARHPTAGNGKTSSSTHCTTCR